MPRRNLTLRNELVVQCLHRQSDIWWTIDDDWVGVPDFTSVALVRVDERTDEILSDGRVDLVTTAER